LLQSSHRISISNKEFRDRPLITWADPAVPLEICISLYAAAVRTLPPAAAEAFEVLVAAAAVAVVLDATFFLGKGEEATRARRERERMVDENRMFAVYSDLEKRVGK